MDFFLTSPEPGFLAFILYFALCYVMVLVFLSIYSKITPYCEWALMRQNNKSATVAFCGALLGFVLPLASAAVHSVSLIDFLIWSAIAAMMQLLTFFTVGWYTQELVERIEQDQLSAGLFLGCSALATGIINAACMSY